MASTLPSALPGVVLASRSPRRFALLTELLHRTNQTFVVDPPDIDETPLAAETVDAYVQRLALGKATVVAQRYKKDVIVIGADTTVDVDGKIFGQPADMVEAAAMLRQLSGRTHRVVTAIALIRGDRQRHGFDAAEVTMKSLTDEHLAWYLSTEESLGKAGAYAVQGHGAALVEGVAGSLSTVVGLPIGLLRALGAELGAGWKIGL